MQSDEELVRLTLNGQVEAFAELVRRWAARVTALCHHRVRRADVADDLAQEALLRSFRSLSTLSDPSKFGAWLSGIAVRACLDWLKARERSTVVFSSLSEDHDLDTLLGRSGLANDGLMRKEHARLLLKAVEQLPDEYRQVVLLYYYQDVTYTELAQQLGVSKATINSRLTKARAWLRERLQGSSLSLHAET